MKLPDHPPGTRSPPTDPRQGGPSLLRVPVTIAVGVVVGWAIIAVIESSSIYAEALVTGNLAVGSALRQNVFRSAVWALTSLVVFELVWRHPLQRDRLGRSLGLQVAWAIPVLTIKILLWHAVGQQLGVISQTFSAGRALAGVAGESATVYIFVVGIAHAVLYAHTARDRERARSELETKLVQAQLQTLKIQLHPHFLFNTLHAISTLVYADPDRAERMIASLSEMLRITLTQRDTQEVPLREELESLQPYLEIERVRLGERLRLEMDIQPEALEGCVPHLLLQPLVENAIRHGIAARKGPGSVRVRAACVDGALRVDVEDDGRGFSGPARPGAVGLVNTRARLERLYGPAHRFEIHSAPGQGTRVRVEVPYRTAAKVHEEALV